MMGSKSPREHNALDHLVKGYSYREMIEQTDISIAQCTHITHIGEKLHVACCP